MAQGSRFHPYSRQRRAEVMAALRANAGKVAKTAREMGMAQRTIRRWRDAESVGQGAISTGKPEAASAPASINAQASGTASAGAGAPVSGGASAGVGEQASMSAQASAGASGAARGAGEGEDLARYASDSWRIIHRASEVVLEKMEELDAKEAASVAGAYLDRQIKVGEEIRKEGAMPREYAARWSDE